MTADTGAAILGVALFLLLAVPLVMAWRSAGSKTPRRATADRTRPEVFDATTSRPPASPATLSGKAYVVDGDTVIIGKTNIRLYGVDAPEMDHPYGRTAKSALFDLCRGQRVHAHVVAVDAYGRTVARCLLSDGRDLLAEMVKRGMALDWAKFSGGDYRPLETPDARRKLWRADARQKGRMHVWARFEARQRDRPARR